MTLSFHGKKSLKASKIKHLRRHRELEHLKQGVGFESNGETHGCAIGCLFNNYDHSLGPELVGLPESILRLADHIFECLPADEANLWAIDWLAAVPVNIPEVAFVTLSDKFQIFWLERQLTQFDNVAYPAVATAVSRVIKLLHSAVAGNEPESAAWSAARSAAWSAAESAAESAARSAAWSAAKSAAWSAAKSAAWSAAHTEARAKRDWLLAALKELKAS